MVFGFVLESLTMTSESTAFLFNFLVRKSKTDMAKSKKYEQNEVVSQQKITTFFKEGNNIMLVQKINYNAH